MLIFDLETIPEEGLGVSSEESPEAFDLEKEGVSLEGPIRVEGTLRRLGEEIRHAPFLDGTRIDHGVVRNLKACEAIILPESRDTLQSLSSSGLAALIDHRGPVARGRPGKGPLGRVHWPQKAQNHRTIEGFRN